MDLRQACGWDTIREVTHARQHHQDLPEQLAPFTYTLPKERIALAPVRPRDTARLLVYRAGSYQCEEYTVGELPSILPPHTLLVVNATKVLPALLPVVCDDGKEVTLLLLPPFDSEIVRALAPRRARAGERLRHRESGVVFWVSAREGKIAVLRPACSREAFVHMLATFGQAPLPPYLAASPLSPAQRRRAYQAIFARYPGSVAAPTASLHFTRRLVRDLKARGHELTSVTLHVGLGTFAPLTQKELSEGLLHEERFHISPRAAHRIRQAQREGRPIVAVGTTVLRTLETVALEYGEVREASGVTQLFIHGAFSFRVATGLFTNFHMPASSLLLLVDAFLGADGAQWRIVYEEALKRGFRFLSFGDASLLWRA